jgi:hypothetical protein
MRLVYALMSPKRQDQINVALDWYAKTPKRNYVRFKATHCRRGHAFSGDNVYLFPDASRRNCKVCAELSRQKYYAKRQKQVENVLTN